MLQISAQSLAIFQMMKSPFVVAMAVKMMVRIDPRGRKLKSMVTHVCIFLIVRKK